MWNNTVGDERGAMRVFSTEPVCACNPTVGRVKTGRHLKHTVGTQCKHTHKHTDKHRNYTLAYTQLHRHSHTRKPHTCHARRRPPCIYTHEGKSSATVSLPPPILVPACLYVQPAHQHAYITPSAFRTTNPGPDPCTATVSVHP